MITPNPFLPGCHPDPSICFADEAFYVVTSSFGRYPGLPIHRSTDLIEWTLVGHVLTETNWSLPDDVDLSDGVWAPTIRHHLGTFYVVFTLARQRRGEATFVCTASAIEGPWDCTMIPGADGIDPSLFFDREGRCWFTAARDATSASATGPGEIWLQEFDVHRRRLIGEQTVIWHGAVAGAWVEAPHIYEHDGRFHLVCAEGGTERNHAVTAASASHVRGPYRTNPRSPLLTHRHLSHGLPVQNVGHADIVTAPDGRSWAVLLGVRPIAGHHTLGRESFLVEVEWEDDGPVFAPGAGQVLLHPAPSSGDALDPARAVSLRGPAGARIRPGEIVIPPSPIRLGDDGVPALVAWPQDDHECAFEATVDPRAVTRQRAGLIAFQNPSHFASLTVRRDHGGPVVEVTVHGDTGRRTVGRHRVEGPAVLRIEATTREYALGVMEPDGFRPLGVVPLGALSTETAGGFVGVLLGVVNEGPSDSGEVRFTDVSHVRVRREAPYAAARAS